MKLLLQITTIVYSLFIALNTYATICKKCGLDEGECGGCSNGSTISVQATDESRSIQGGELVRDARFGAATDSDIIPDDHNEAKGFHLVKSGGPTNQTPGFQGSGNRLSSKQQNVQTVQPCSNEANKTTLISHFKSHFKPVETTSNTSNSIDNPYVWLTELLTPNEDDGFAAHCKANGYNHSSNIETDSNCCLNIRKQIQAKKIICIYSNNEIVIVSNLVNVSRMQPQARITTFTQGGDGWVLSLFQGRQQNLTAIQQALENVEGIFIKVIELHNDTA